MFRAALLKCCQFVYRIFKDFCCVRFNIRQLHTVTPCKNYDWIAFSFLTTKNEQQNRKIKNSLELNSTTYHSSKFGILVPRLNQITRGIPNAAMPFLIYLSYTHYYTPHYSLLFLLETIRHLYSPAIPLHIFIIYIYTSTFLVTLYNVLNFTKEFPLKFLCSKITVHIRTKFYVT